MFRIVFYIILAKTTVAGKPLDDKELTSTGKEIKTPNFWSIFESQLQISDESQVYDSTENKPKIFKTLNIEKAILSFDPDKEDTLQSPKIDVIPLSNRNVIECLDLNLLIYTRKVGADTIESITKSTKFDLLPNSEIKILINSKCQSTFKIDDESLIGSEERQSRRTSKNDGRGSKESNKEYGNRILQKRIHPIFSIFEDLSNTLQNQYLQNESTKAENHETEIDKRPMENYFSKTDDPLNNIEKIMTSPITEIPLLLDVNNHELQLIDSAIRSGQNNQEDNQTLQLNTISKSDNNPEYRINKKVAIAKNDTVNSNNDFETKTIPFMSRDDKSMNNNRILNVDGITYSYNDKSDYQIYHTISSSPAALDLLFDEKHKNNQSYDSDEKTNINIKKTTEDVDNTLKSNIDLGYRIDDIVTTSRNGLLITTNDLKTETIPSLNLPIVVFPETNILEGKNESVSLEAASIISPIFSNVKLSDQTVTNDGNKIYAYNEIPRKADIISGYKDVPVNQVKNAMTVPIAESSVSFDETYKHEDNINKIPINVDTISKIDIDQGYLIDDILKTPKTGTVNVAKVVKTETINFPAHETIPSIHLPTREISDYYISEEKDESDTPKPAQISSPFFNDIGGIKKEISGNDIHPETQIHNIKTAPVAALALVFDQNNNFFKSDKQNNQNSRKIYVTPSNEDTILESNIGYDEIATKSKTNNKIGNNVIKIETNTENLELEENYKIDTSPRASMLPLLLNNVNQTVIDDRNINKNSLSDILREGDVFFNSDNASITGLPSLFDFNLFDEHPSNEQSAENDESNDIILSKVATISKLNIYSGSQIDDSITTSKNDVIINENNYVTDPDSAINLTNISDQYIFQGKDQHDNTIIAQISGLPILFNVNHYSDKQSSHDNKKKDESPSDMETMSKSNVDQEYRFDNIVSKSNNDTFIGNNLKTETISIMNKTQPVTQKEYALKANDKQTKLLSLIPGVVFSHPTHGQQSIQNDKSLSKMDTISTSNIDDNTVKVLETKIMSIANLTELEIQERHSFEENDDTSGLTSIPPFILNIKSTDPTIYDDENIDNNNRDITKAEQTSSFNDDPGNKMDYKIIEPTAGLSFLFDLKHKDDLITGSNKKNYNNKMNKIFNNVDTVSKSNIDKEYHINDIASTTNNNVILSNIYATETTPFINLAKPETLNQFIFKDKDETYHESNQIAPILSPLNVKRSDYKVTDNVNFIENNGNTPNEIVTQSRSNDESLNQFEARSLLLLDIKHNDHQFIDTYKQDSQNDKTKDKTLSNVDIDQRYSIENVISTVNNGAGIDTKVLKSVRISPIKIPNLENSDQYIFYGKGVNVTCAVPIPLPVIQIEPSERKDIEFGYKNNGGKDVNVEMSKSGIAYPIDNDVIKTRIDNDNALNIPALLDYETNDGKIINKDNQNVKSKLGQVDTLSSADISPGLVLSNNVGIGLNAIDAKTTLLDVSNSETPDKYTIPEEYNLSVKIVTVSNEEAEKDDKTYKDSFFLNNMYSTEINDYLTSPLPSSLPSFTEKPISEQFKEESNTKSQITKELTSFRKQDNKRIPDLIEKPDYLFTSIFTETQTIPMEFSKISNAISNDYTPKAATSLASFAEPTVIPRKPIKKISENFHKNIIFNVEEHLTTFLPLTEDNKDEEFELNKMSSTKNNYDSVPLVRSDVSVFLDEKNIEVFATTQNYDAVTADRVPTYTMTENQNNTITSLLDLDERNDIEEDRDVIRIKINPPSQAYIKTHEQYAESEIKIPKIISREFSNGSAISSIDGYENIPNNDFKMPDDTFNEIVLRNADSNLDTDTTDNEDLSKPVLRGRLVFLLSDDDTKIPASFIQNPEGEIQIALEGKSLCDKLLSNTKEKKSLLITKLCSNAVDLECITEKTLTLNTRK